MSAVRTFCRDQTGASAAEFALILPVFLLFIVGLIDVGRYAWALNEAEKATQVGARWAVATDVVPAGLAEFSFATDADPKIPQGDSVSQAAFPGIHCESNGGNVSCTCLASCNSGLVGTPDQAAFDAIVGRMRTIYPQMDPDGDDVTIDYLHSGLGFSGDPNGPDVSPIVRVGLRDLQFDMYFMLGRQIDLPSFSYSLVMEDAQGSFANY